MSRPIDVFALLQRGGELTAEEERQLVDEWREAKLAELCGAISARSLDQPIKVVPLQNNPPAVVRGYFTQQKFITGKTPAEMEAVLGIFGRLSPGAMILQFQYPLKPGDYESKAYSYLPDGEPYKYRLEEKTFLPGKGAPQWRLTHEIPAKCIATLQPGERYLVGRVPYKA